MSNPHGITEPPIDPLADTNPSLTIRPVELGERSLPAWRRAVGFISLLLAAGLTVGTALILASPAPAPPPALPLPTSEQTQTTTAAATLVATPVPAEPVINVSTNAAAPLDPQVVAALLNAPLAALNSPSGIAVQRDNLNPFTLVPERARSEVIQYDAAQGDTIYTIAERFGVKPESIAWSNSRRIVQVLRPGDTINIPPADGVYTQVIGSKTIAEIAAEYKITDPYIVLDSEYNDLFGVAPETILPSGSWLFIPGGIGEDITWNPGVTTDESDPTRRGFVTSFAPGDPGSCGNVDNPGGGAAWVNPLPGGTYVRGFTAFHPGIDLSAPPGTPIRAANGGVVIFSGWNSWGYGNTVVLAHGPFLTLYGHMSSIAVGCGQLVSPGSVIGGVGNTGNSSGPHLHFEIRNGNIQTDPLVTIPNLGL